MLKAPITKGVLPEDTKIHVSREFAKELDTIGVDHYAVFELRWKDLRESVRYIHTDDFQHRKDKEVIYVDRAFGGASRKTFPVGSCITWASTHPIDGGSE